MEPRKALIVMLSITGMFLIILKTFTEVVVNSFKTTQNNISYISIEEPKPLKANIDSIAAAKVSPPVETPPETQEKVVAQKIIAPKIQEEKSVYCQVKSIEEFTEKLYQETYCQDPLPHRLVSCLTSSNNCVNLFPRGINKDKPPEYTTECITEKSNCYPQDLEIYPTAEILNLFDRCHQEYSIRELNEDISKFIKEAKSECMIRDEMPHTALCRTFAYLCLDAPKDLPPEKKSELNFFYQCYTNIENCIDLY